ncbi:MAG TPA: REJ domain-containing protein, partial [Nitrososphaera sp.]|nr:REJ domain-containing protein [Nitrososphaera sp.]
QMSGPPVQLSTPNAATTSFTAPSNLQADITISFKLTVTDSSGLSSSDTVSILVRHTATPPPTPPPPPETAPIAVVGPDQTVNEGSLVTLDGSASRDPDGDPITFAWTQMSGPPVQLSTPNAAKTSFTAPSNLQVDATLFFKLTVTDTAGLSDSVVQKITVKRSTSEPPPDTGTEQIYTAKPGGRVFTKMNPSGGNCKSDGIRFNLANEHTLVDRETTWVFTLNNNPESCTDKPWWNPKIGSHGSTGEGSGLYEASVFYKGGFKSMRTEGPHPQYHSCSGYQHANNIPPMPQGKPIGIKTAQWRIPNGVHVEFWYDFTGGGKGPWIKYASLDDTLPGHCNGGSIKGPIGMNGELIGPARAQDTMRLNGGSATY